MSNDIGTIKTITGTSINMNNDPGRLSLQKPGATNGTASPGGTKPPKPADGSVPMPK